MEPWTLLKRTREQEAYYIDSKKNRQSTSLVHININMNSVLQFRISFQDISSLANIS